ncbi:MAG: dihydrolipoyl dehydrogenase family protein [Rhodothalassiaceae bacterium]
MAEDTSRLSADLCIIGGGSGGLVVAAVAAPLGVKTVLIEGHKMGGDCLNYGCVPSKAVIAAGKYAHHQRESGRFGVTPATGAVDFKAVHDHIHDVIAGIAPHDSPERFEQLGAKVIQAKAAFTDQKTVQANGAAITAKRFVIATGSRAVVPPIEGLADVPYLTNETVFDLTEQPRHLIVLGGGPIGMEIAQAHRRLGAQVTVVEMGDPMGKDDPELVEVVLEAVRADGVDIRRNTKAVKVAQQDNEIVLTVQENGQTQDLRGSHLLVATGRAPVVDGLNLEAAGVDYDKRGIKVDPRLRTSNKKIYAVGDCRGGQQFTHAASYDAGIVIRNALFRSPAKADPGAIPHVTYTDPELAQIGPTEAEARDQHGDKIRVVRFPYQDNDRARAERATRGFVKVVTDKKGKILGAGIVGLQAGELLQPWILAIGQGLTMRAFTEMVAPYPTLGEINKRVASEYYREALFSGKARALVKFLQMLG